MNMDVYKSLAERLDSLPNGFPPTEIGVELRILAKLFNPFEASIASQLKYSLETADQISDRLGYERDEITKNLKTMARKGLINAGRTEEGLGFGLLPFVVGIYEMQVGSLDEEMASLFDEYYKLVFASMMGIKPTFHRVIPVNESVQVDITIQPFESVAEIISTANAWGVLDCICRKQKLLIGDPCQHPIDVCMALSKKPGAFDNSDTIKSLTVDGAFEVLEKAAKAGLVHSVSNSQEGISYICNCCTCSCGILRGMAEMGISDVIAHSSFINYVDVDLCLACEDCIDYCQFSALTIDGVAKVNQSRCVGCGVCVSACPEVALHLIQRAVEEDTLPPVTHNEWLIKRANSRGIDINAIL